MRLAHDLLTILYLAAPVVAGLLLAWAARRRRSKAPIAGFGVTLVSSALISVGFCLVIAFMSDASVSLWQILLTSYLLTGVLSILKGFSWTLKQVLEWAMRVHPRQTVSHVRDAGWAVRMAAAIFLRIVLLFGIGLPYLMSLVIVYRAKVVPNDTPREVLGAGYQAVTFESTDGVKLSGWWIPAQRPLPGKEADPTWGAKTIVLCHGLGANKSNQLALVRDLTPNGYNVLAFDFRAHGASGGQTTSFGALEQNDVLGAVQWTRANHPDESRRLYGLGVSMGAVALIEAASQPTAEGQAIDAVAVYSAYDSFPLLAQSVGQRYLAWPMNWLALKIAMPLVSLHAGVDLKQLVPADRVEAISPRPILVLHGRGDPMIPFDAGVRLYDAASQPTLRFWVGQLDRKMNWVIPPTGSTKVSDDNAQPADHNNLLFYDDAARAVRLFFESQRASM